MSALNSYDLLLGGDLECYTHTIVRYYILCVCKAYKPSYSLLL